MTPLDPVTVPLNGLRLVEASAGTGKTFTIALLYLRLLIEERLSPDQILVVTYTRAATAELKSRIRLRIEHALALLEGRGACDPLLSALLQGHRDAEPRLRSALLNFDRARISTIHGFAQRVLQETAFETAQPFDLEVIEDDRDFLTTTVTDFWTQTFYRMPEVEARLVLSRFSLQSAIVFAREVLRRRDAPRVSSLRGVDGLGDRLQDWQRARDAALSHFVPGEIRPLLEGLNRQRYTDRRVSEWLSQLPEVEPFSVKPEMLELLSRGQLVTRKNQPEPRHPFFDAVSEWRAAHSDLMDCVSTRVMQLRAGLAEYVAARSNERRTAAFDDLIRNLARALDGPRGEELVSSLRRTYRAALIDEFQDTDPLQYEIFQRTFAPLSLFLIGDPKQAIYGFRGADVFAYFAAARAADARRYGMGVNYRSSSDVLAAIERLFTARRDPFVLPQVQFQPVSAAPGIGGGVRGDPLGDSALTFLLHRAEKPLSKTDAKAAAVETTARVIATVLCSNMTLDGRPVEARDFAVLTRTNDFAQLVQNALRDRGIPAVFRGDKSVFSSSAASELQRVLASMLEPNAQTLLRGALLSDLAAVSADHLVEDDGSLLVEHARRFSELRRRWVDRGFMDAFRGFLDDYSVEGRLLARPGGERTLTDLLHLAELLHRAEHERGLGPARLTDWFARARLDPSWTGYTGDVTTQMRLESDEPAVELFTVHTAKGLEFPLVICPELWNASFAPSPKPGPITFHRGDELTLDLSEEPDPAHLEAAQLEWRGENQRLLYVALTRAVHRIYIPWGDFSGAEASPLAHLLGGSEIFPVLGGPVGAVDASEVPDLRVPPPSGGSKRGTAKSFPGRVQIERGTTSYSAWVADANAQHFAERDIDAQARNEDSGSAELLPGLPAGASTGQLVHAVLERVDLRAPDPAVTVRALNEFSCPSRWATEIDSMVNAVRGAPLSLSEDSRHSLSEYDGARPELEFLLPLRPISSWQSTIYRALVDEGGLFTRYAEAFSALEVRQVAGYLRGFIDWIGEVAGFGLVVDYKSNLLPSYGAATIGQAMVEHHYVLQALVYMVALRRQLAVHRHNLRLGGAHYIFIRGVDDDGGGVCSLHPSGSLLDTFEGALLGSEP